MTESESRDKIGRVAFARHNPEHDRKYMEVARRERREFTNQAGRIMSYSNSHGLCFEVMFASGRAWYEPDELEGL